MVRRASAAARDAAVRNPCPLGAARVQGGAERCPLECSGLWQIELVFVHWHVIVFKSKAVILWSR